MKVELILDPNCGEPEVTVRAAARTAEVEDLLRRLEEGPAGILGFREDRAVPLIPGTVLRFYGEDKGVLAQTEDGVWRGTPAAVRAGGAAGPAYLCANLPVGDRQPAQGDRLGPGPDRHIRMTLTGGTVCWVSRRYVKKIKEALGL